MSSPSAIVRAITLGLAALGLLIAVESTRWAGTSFPGFLLMPNRVVPSIGLPGWSGVDEGRPLYQHVVLAIDDVPTKGSATVYDSVALRGPGSLVRYQVVRQGTVETRTFPVLTFGWSTHLTIFGAYLLTGLAYVLLAAVAGARWTARPLFPALTVFSWLVATFALTAIDLYGAGRLFRLHAFAEAMLPAVAIHLALVCPRDHLGRRTGILPLLYGSGLALAITYQLFLYEPAAYSVIHDTCQALVGVGLLGFTAGIGFALHEPTGELDAAGLRYCLGGALVGFVVPALIFGISGLCGGLIPVNATAWFSFVFPLSCLVALRASVLRPLAVPDAAAAPA
jgi:hypothetical protein